MADPNIDWPLPPAMPSLGDRDLHVWAIALNPPDEILSRCQALLSPEESERAARFRFERDQRRFAIAHGAVRDILARYIRQPPGLLRFNETPRGKPSLVQPDGAQPLHFNLTHSDELALLAVTRVCPVGVDVERLRELRDADAIANRFFSERESSGLAALPADQKPAAFFNLWTRKEAWLKATGIGISEHLDKVEVSFLPGEPARLLTLPDSAEATDQWSLIDLRPAAGFVAAIAIRSADLQVGVWRWADS